MRGNKDTVNHHLFAIILLAGCVVAFYPSVSFPQEKHGKTGSIQARIWASGQEPEKEYPKLDGKEDCYNYRRAGKKVNCSCSHKCDLKEGDPNNRYIVPGHEDYKCSNHCKKDKCKCKTKCQT